MLRTPALLESTEVLARVIVERRGNAQIALADVASVLDTHREITRIIRINGEPGVRLAVRKQSGYNTVEVAQAIAREVERINRDFPQLSVSVMEDRSRFIQASLRNVGMAIGFGSFLAIENIYRKRAAGEGLRASAIAGASEVAPAILASTLTTLAIFLPLLFLSGVAGVLFRQLAFVVAFALLCAMLLIWKRNQVPRRSIGAISSVSIRYQLMSPDVILAQLPTIYARYWIPCRGQIMCRF